jgi:hypothetical protein
MVIFQPTKSIFDFKLEAKGWLGLRIGGIAKRMLEEVDT